MYTSLPPAIEGLGTRLHEVIQVTVYEQCVFSLGSTSQHLLAALSMKTTTLPLPSSPPPSLPPLPPHPPPLSPPPPPPPPLPPPPPPPPLLHLLPLLLLPLPLLPPPPPSLELETEMVCSVS